MDSKVSETTAQAEGLQALRETERRFRTLITATDDVVYSMSPDWSIMRQLQGQEFLATTASDNPDWLGDYIPKSDQGAVLAAIREAVENKSVFDLEHRVRRADGSVGWTHSRAVPLLGEQGEITEWFGFAHDISGRRRAEEGLQQAEQRLRDVLETSLDAVYRRDLRTDSYDYVSPAIETITGFSPEEFMGLPLNDVLERIHPDDRQVVLDAIPHALRTGELTAEYRLRHEDGEYVWLSDHAKLTRDDEGEPAYITGVVRDISVAKQFELELTERAKYAEALNRINDAVHSTLDFGEIMNRAVIDAATASGLDAVAVHLREDDHWSFAYSYGLPDELAALELADDQAPISMSVAETGQVLLMEDVANDPVANRRLMARFNIGALMAMPLTFRGEVFAVLFSGCYGAVTRFDAVRVDFMTNVAATLSLALANARMYQSERLVAETLQEAVLALPEKVPGIAFAHSYHSAADAARVGGDFYDIFEMEHDVVAVVIGDVAGKGLQAAVMTTLLRNTIRAHAAENHSPAAVLSLTNALAYRHSETDAFATVFFGLIDRRDGRMRFCNAGHTATVVAKPNGRVVPLAANSSVVGAFADAQFSDEETSLEFDDLLVLYTDGLIEARQDGDFYGEERLFDLISAEQDGDPAKTVRVVVDDVLAFTGGRLSDDVAVLTIKRLAHGSETPTPQKLEMLGM